MDYPLGQRLRELPGPLLLTGHTGFKGAWMTFLLEHLKVPVVGYSLPAEKDSLYSRAKRDGKIPEKFADIRDYQALEAFMDEHKPSTLIHMAAQPLVLKSYQFPRETFEVNVMGTVNLLDIAFKKDYVKAIVVVSTDKVYRNDNSGRPFIESDPLGGKDPYSASKVGTESVVSGWQQIKFFFGGPNLASARAGNVIGGGDFAKDRIIPDLVRGILTGNSIQVRNPSSTRPWQHVIEPLVGYLLMLESLLTENKIDTANFGPNESDISVEQLVFAALQIFPDIKTTNDLQDEDKSLTESITLNLDSTFITDKIGWRPKWASEEAIQHTFLWWKGFLENIDPEELCMLDIDKYFKSDK